MNILAIETSCDETAIAIVSFTNNRISVRSNIISSQIALHAKFGGVVPNLAAREHEKNILPVLTKAITQANMQPDDIDLLAVTQGPGLIPALVIGVNTARTFSYCWHKPLLGIHHIEGHIYANFINRDLSSIKFPIIALVVSGGHTQLIFMRNWLHYEIIGQTQDDAVGEAFDKIARMLNLSYPGGPEISIQAEQYYQQNPAHSPNDKILNKFNLEELPRPMYHTKNYNFSFSGIKTSVLYKIKDFRKKKNISENDPLPINFVTAMSAAFQDAVCDVLITKTCKAAQEYQVKTVLLAGGVSANTQLRSNLGNTIKNALPNVNYHIPPLEYCVDNAVMIASAAAIRWQQTNTIAQKNAHTTWRTIDADAQLNL